MRECCNSAHTITAVARLPPVKANMLAVRRSIYIYEKLPVENKLVADTSANCTRIETISLSENKPLCGGGSGSGCCHSLQCSQLHLLSHILHAPKHHNCQFGALGSPPLHHIAVSAPCFDGSAAAPTGTLTVRQ